MKAFKDVKGVAAVWMMPNVDTDVITPMKRMLRNGNELEKYAFESFRFVDGDGDKGILNPDFPLNQACSQGAKIMIVGENFGCGSSRETAAMAIAGMGIQCLIGQSFGGIFFKNCFQQGILPVRLPKEIVEELAAQAESGGEFEVDLLRCRVIAPDGKEIPFEIKPLRQQSLLEGLDDVRMTLKKKEQIDAFFAADRIRRPWMG